MNINHDILYEAPGDFFSFAFWYDCYSWSCLKCCNVAMFPVWLGTAGALGNVCLREMKMVSLG